MDKTRPRPIIINIIINILVFVIVVVIDRWIILSEILNRFESVYIGRKNSRSHRLHIIRFTRHRRWGRRRWRSSIVDVLSGRRGQRRRSLSVVSSMPVSLTIASSSSTRNKSTHSLQVVEVEEVFGAGRHCGFRLSLRLWRSRSRSEWKGLLHRWRAVERWWVVDCARLGLGQSWYTIAIDLRWLRRWREFWLEAYALAPNWTEIAGTGWHWFFA